MKCIICFDHLLKTESVVQCRNHGFHASCLYMWNQSRNASGEQRLLCMICMNRLPEILLESIEHRHRSRLCHLAECDNLLDFIEEFENEKWMSHDFFIDLVKCSLKARTFQVAKYLKLQETKKYIWEREKVIIELIKTPGTNHLRWILGRFDEVFEDFLDYNFGEDMIPLFRESECYEELNWIYREMFSHLNDDTRLRVGIELYTSAQRGIWTTYGMDTDYLSMFSFIMGRHPILSCHIITKILPRIVIAGSMKQGDLPNGIFRSTVDHCYGCSSTHVWDVLLLLLKLNHQEAFRDLLLYHNITSALPLSYNELAERIVACEFPDIARSAIERAYKFEKKMNWKLTIEQKLNPDRKFSWFLRRRANLENYCVQSERTDRKFREDSSCRSCMKIKE